MNNGRKKQTRSIYSISRKPNSAEVMWTESSKAYIIRLLILLTCYSSEYFWNLKKRSFYLFCAFCFAANVLSCDIFDAFMLVSSKFTELAFLLHVIFIF